MQQINIIIADDHRLFADGLSTILQQSGQLHILNIACNGRELLQLLDQHPQVDLILLDISMPDMNGIQAAENIKTNYPQIPIMVVTMNDSPDVIAHLMNIGVNGIVLKNTGKAELMEAISEISKGNNYYSANVTKQLARGYQPDDTHSWQLTKREKEILQLIFEGLSTTEMAEKLFISPYTVETHRKNLLVKTGFKKSSQLIKQALELGYISTKLG